VFAIDEEELKGRKMKVNEKKEISVYLFSVDILKTPMGQPVARVMNPPRITGYQRIPFLDYVERC